MTKTAYLQHVYIPQYQIDGSKLLSMDPQFCTQLWIVQERQNQEPNRSWKTQQLLGTVQRSQ